MNTWGYLLSIAALLLLAGAMLYARFASRSRAKSLHHPPVDWSPSLAASSAAPVLEERLPETSAAEAVLRVESHVTSAKEESPVRDRVYLDELQEAAAGLAMLMRSSPVARAEPVVFAPETEDAEEVVGEEAAQTEEDCGDAAETAEALVGEEAEALVEAIAESEEPFAAASFEADVRGVAETEADAGEVEAILALDGESAPEETAFRDTTEAGIEEEPVPQPRTLRELLGEAVAAQFDRIDEGLDALESLVLGIESGFASLALLEQDEIAEIGATAPEVRVAEAA